MKKQILSPRKIILLLIALVSTQFVQAQNFQLIPNTNQFTNNGSAPQGHMRWIRTCFIISAAEMATSGATASQVFGYLKLNQNVAATFGATGNVNIYMQNTSDATYLKGTNWTTLLGGMTQVASTPLTLPTVIGVYTINYNLAQFTYTGGAMYVAIEYNNPTSPIATTLTGHLVSTALVGGVAAAVRGQSTVNTAPTLGSITSRPDLQMGLVGAGDITVSNIYTLGKVPIEYGAPMTITANVSNVSVPPSTVNNINVTLNISGANSFTNSVTIPSLAPGASTVVTFAPYSPTSLSVGDVVAVTATAAGDAIPGNNTRTWAQNVTPNVYTYKNGAVANTGGVGFTGGTGDFVAKFNSNPGITPPYTNPPEINEIKVDFAALVAGQTYQVGIWDANGLGGIPGTLLWTSPPYTQAAGTSFIPVPNIAVSGDYFVGVRQTGTLNINFAYQLEAPIRPQTFYYASPTGATNWTDFATPGTTNFRFSIEVQVRIPVPPNCAINNMPADNSQLACNNPTLTWQSGGGAPTSYEVYLSDVLADVATFDPIARVDSSAATSYTTSGLLPNMTYYWAARPLNADGAAIGCSVQSFVTGTLPVCYCYPTYTGIICAGGISAVSINTLSNTSVCAPPAHASYNPVGPLTTTLGQTGVYTISVTTTDADIISVWIDYNQNGTFEASEWTQVTLASVANVPSTANIFIPGTALLGPTLMRVRSRFTTNINGAGDACTSFGSGSSEDYVVTIIPPVPCTGTPAPGNTIASASSVCAGNVVNFSLQNPTSGTGVTYQWYNPSGPIAGATNDTYSQTITATDTIYCAVTCSGNTGNSSMITVAAAPFIDCYCASGATFNADEEIYEVTLNGASTDPLYANANGCTVAAPGPGSVLSFYSNFKTLGSLTSIAQGSTVPFTIAENECDGAIYYAFGTSIWIDLNHNGSFADANEQVFVEQVALVGPRNVTGNITIPITALTGQTVMRVIVAEGFAGAALTPCLSFGYGETEDYLIDITGTTLCTGTPTPGNTIASATTVCPNATVNLSLQNNTTGTGVIYQWYNGAGAISGATNATHTATITAVDSFHCAVTCTNSAATGLSSSVTISLNNFLNCYCLPITSCNFPDIITNVTFAGINRTSGCDNSATGYTNYNTVPNIGTVIAGSTNPISVSTGGDQEGAAVWIDWDQNGTFDASELVLNGYTGNVPETYTGNVTVPLNAALGSTKMRVRCVYFQDPSTIVGPCANTTFGETEDYLIIVNPAITNSVLNLNLFIEGYWDGSSAMLPVLFNQGQTLSTTICDSIKVELHDATAPYAMAYTTDAVLNTNGTATCTFSTAVSGSYYIVVKHRNANQTWSANPVAVGPAFSYDFTTAANQAYDVDTSVSPTAQVQVAPGVWAFYSGDIEVDENMDLLDLGLIEIDISEFVFGYYYSMLPSPPYTNAYRVRIDTDLNGDGNVDLLDSPIEEGNLSLFIFSNHP